MPLPSTYEDALALEPFLADPTPQSVFGLPPPQPTTNFFGGGFGGAQPSSGGGFDYANMRVKGGVRMPDQSVHQQRLQKLQMEQQAQQQAAVVGQILQGVDPTSEQYPQIRAQIATRFPLAYASPMAKHAIDTFDALNKQAMADPNRGFRNQLALQGIAPEQLGAGADLYSAANNAHQQKLSREDAMLQQKWAHEDSVRPLPKDRPSPAEQELRVLQQALRGYQSRMDDGPQAQMAKDRYNQLLPYVLAQKQQAGRALDPNYGAPPQTSAPTGPLQPGQSVQTQFGTITRHQ